jgi:hypothetical protein
MQRVMLVIVAVVLAGCSSSATPSPSPSSTPTPPPAPAATPGVPTAAQEFAAALAAYTHRLDAVTAKYGTSTVLKDERVAWKDAAAALATLDTALHVITFSGQAASDAGTLEKLVAAAQARASSAAEATKTATMAGLAAAATKAENAVTPAASRLRADLGLPPSP